MKTIKSLSILFTFLFCLPFICDAQKIVGSGPIVSKTLDVSTFDGLGLGVSATVYIKKGSQQKVTIKAQQNIIDNISTKVSKGSWKVKFKKKTKNYDDITIYVTMAELSDLSIGGSGSIIVEDKFSTSGNIDLSIGGSGEIQLAAAAQQISCSIGGSGEIDLKGSANKLSISIAGSGEINAFGMQAQYCEVSSAGSGDVEVSVSDELSVSMAGGGDVRYKGNPKVDKSIVGGGGIEKVGR